MIAYGILSGHVLLLHIYFLLALFAGEIDGLK